MFHYFTEEEIAESTPELANEMRLVNLAFDYLKTSRQYIALGWVGIVIAIVLAFRNQLLFSLAANFLGIISTYIGGRYNNKVKAVTEQSKYFKGD